MKQDKMKILEDVGLVDLNGIQQTHDDSEQNADVYKILAAQSLGRLRAALSLEESNALILKHTEFTFGDDVSSERSDELDGGVDIPKAEGKKVTRLLYKLLEINNDDYPEDDS